MSSTSHDRGEDLSGALVRYHGSLTRHHGVWRVARRIRYGEGAGRFVLQNPDNPRETLIPTSQNSFTVLPARDG